MPDQDRWPEFENALPILEGRYPEAAAKAKIRPMGFFEKLLGGNRNVATTDLDGTIAYNAEAGRRHVAAGNSIDSLLAHELQHVNQQLKRSLFQNIVERFKQGQLPWEQRPDEIDAVAAERPTKGFRRLADVSLGGPRK